MSEHRRGQIFVSGERLHRLLELPEDLHIVAVVGDSVMPAVQVIVEGTGAPVCEPGAVPSMVPERITEYRFTDDDGITWFRREWTP